MAPTTTNNASHGQGGYSNMAVVLPIITSGLFLSAYICSLIMACRYAQNHPRALNKTSGKFLQRYAPAFYLFVVTASLVELSISAWLLIQDAYVESVPNSQSRRAITLLLFCACWTSLTSGVYSMLFLHPIWTEHYIASIGAQMLWLFLTLILWIIGAGLLDGALPQLLVNDQCGTLVYCKQIQGLFAVAIIATIALSIGMTILGWTAAGSTAVRIPPNLWKRKVSPDT